MTVKANHQTWFLAVWVLCAVLAGSLYYHWHIAKDYVGIVEAIAHDIGARDSGVIRQMLVSIKDDVSEGQILAVLDTSDIDNELVFLNGELEKARVLEKSHRDRFTLEIQRMRLQLDNASSDVTNRLAEMKSKQAELTGLNAEIERLEKAETAGLGHSRNFTDLVLKRDALQSFLKMQEGGIQRGGNSHVQDQGITGVTDDESIINSMLAETAERIDEIRKDIIDAENRMKWRRIVSPCDGFVVEIFARTGDTVRDFDPILSVMEKKSGFLNVFIPEKSDVAVREGMQVMVYPVRSDAGNTSGQVSFIHPGYSRVPDRLTVRGQALWARVVRVSLDPSHTLIPGEIAHVRIRDGRPESANLSTQALADGPETVAAGPPGCQQDIHPVRIPDSISGISRLEPSGIVWLAGARQFVVISDDTGIKDTDSEHSPWLFLMDEQGGIQPDPVIIQGVDSVNDLEAITPAENNSFYLISSQNISRNQKRLSDRRQLLKIRYEHGQFTLQKQQPFFNIILDSFSHQELIDLGLTEADSDGLPVLNIEGAASKDRMLYLGLKQPVSDRGAIIWRLSDPETFLDTGILHPGQLSVFGYVDLGWNKDRMGGISDLAFDSQGRLWALSTIPNVEPKDQTGGLHRIDLFADGRMKAISVCRFSGLKPEGLCFDPDRRVMIVFDADQAIPSFLSGELDRL